MILQGPPGTGKTMAAEVMAQRLKLPMYRIDLSQVVNKYIGETEKNLNKVFEIAEGFNGILFFDEADALFGRRTETKDANDRYANIEISYLLGRLESFKGVTILATNLKEDVDTALISHLYTIINFPSAEPEQKNTGWMQKIRSIISRFLYLNTK